MLIKKYRRSAYSIRKLKRRFEIRTIHRFFSFSLNQISVVSYKSFSLLGTFSTSWVRFLKEQLFKKFRPWKLSPVLLNSYSFYSHSLPYYRLEDTSMKRTSSEFFIHHKLLILNFYKKRFFPVIRNIEGHTYFTSSLGMFSKFFNKGKSFIRSKSSFLVSAAFLRKILVYSGLLDLILLIKKIPVYFNEILNVIHNPAIPFYDHPFHGLSVDESLIFPEFRFNMFIFFNNKSFGRHKVRLRGRLKRKISRRLQRLNRVLD